MRCYVNISGLLQEFMSSTLPEWVLVLLVLKLYVIFYQWIHNHTLYFAKRNSSLLNPFNLWFFPPTTRWNSFYQMNGRKFLREIPLHEALSKNLQAPEEVSEHPVQRTENACCQPKVEPGGRARLLAPSVLCLLLSLAKPCSFAGGKWFLHWSADWEDVDSDGELSCSG